MPKENGNKYIGDVPQLEWIKEQYDYLLNEKFEAERNIQLRKTQRKPIGSIILQVQMMTTEMKRLDETRNYILLP